MPTQLMPHFTLEEFLHSDTANAKGIDNSHPPHDVVAHLTVLAYVMERVRKLCGDKVIKISSGYRCPALNSAVGGASNSAHLYGCACDFNVDGLSIDKVCEIVAPHMEKLWIDQLIHETGGGAQWVHLGLANPPWNDPRNDFFFIG